MDQTTENLDNLMIYALSVVLLEYGKYAHFNQGLLYR